MKTIKGPIYKAADGSEHETAEAAEKHDALCGAIESFKIAARAVMTAIGAGGLTADGQPFDMEKSRTYYTVIRRYGSPPHLHEVHIWPYYADVELDHGDGPTIVLREGVLSRDKPQMFAINKLYLGRAAAQAAHIEACKVWLAEMQTEIAGIVKAH